MCISALGVCAARVVSFRDVYDKPNDQFNAREFFTPITHPESGTHRIPNTPWQLPGTEAMTHRHAPCFGEHSQEVFLEEAGISEDEYRELVELGVTGTERL